jgi:hypothetical protein
MPNVSLHHRIFIRAPLRCARASQDQALPEQLRRKELFFAALYGHDSAALARGARFALTAKSCPDTCLVCRK